MTAVVVGKGEMMVHKFLPCCAFAALAGCASLPGADAFRLSAGQVNAAWGRAESEWRLNAQAREGDEEGTDPYRAMSAAIFSAASCRWTERGRAADRRYRVSRGSPRSGRERHWVEESGTLYRDAAGWSFSTSVPG
jgi:hypothetical protein